MPSDISGSFKTVTDASAAVSFFTQNTAACSTEQLYSPIVIRSGGTASSGAATGFEQPAGDGNSAAFNSGNVSPTRQELDPYFSSVLGNGSQWMNENDFQMSFNNGQGANGPDLNVRKVNRSSISQVSVVHHRGPMIMAGWGFDIADRPTPSQSGSAFFFDSRVVNDRSSWKAGPIDFRWDNIRKVWTMGHHMICGVAEGAIAPGNPCSPSTFNVKVFRNSNVNGLPASLSNCYLNETVVVKNRDPSLVQEDVPGQVFVVAAQINYEYIPIWVGCPEVEDPPKPPPSCVC